MRKFVLNIKLIEEYSKDYIGFSKVIKKLKINERDLHELILNHDEYFKNLEELKTHKNKKFKDI